VKFFWRDRRVFGISTEVFLLAYDRLAGDASPLKDILLYVKGLANRADFVRAQAFTGLTNA
jgi:hypothetical protein